MPLLEGSESVYVVWAHVRSFSQRPPQTLDFMVELIQPIRED